MKAIRCILGFMIAGLLVGGAWGGLGSVGLFAGYAAAIIIIGPLWFMNHYVGLIENEKGAAWVDMALGIAVACTMRDVFMKGTSAFVDATPTLALVLLGAVIGGTTAALIEKDMERKAEKDTAAPARKSA